MATPLSNLTDVKTLGDSDLLLVQQSSTAKKVTAGTLKSYLATAISGHGSISSVLKVGTSGTRDTYRIKFTDGTSFDYVITNGVTYNILATIGEVNANTVSGKLADAMALKAVANGIKENKVNYLDNSLLSNPINQRNRTDYTDGSGYTIDRWFVSNVSAYVRTGYVSLQASSANATFNQVIDTAVADTLVNKRVTLAVCLNDGSVACGAFTLSAGIDNRIATGVAGWSMGVYFRDNGQLVARMIHTTTTMSNLQLRWVALYDGDYTVDTLPGYTYRGYAAELAECQRYYQRIIPDATMELSVSTAISATAIYPGFKIAPMRAAPSVNCSDITGILVSPEGATSNAKTATAIARFAWSPSGHITVSITTSGLTARTFYRILLKADTVLAFSADL